MQEEGWANLDQISSSLFIQCVDVSLSEHLLVHGFLSSHLHLLLTCHTPHRQTDTLKN